MSYNNRRKHIKINTNYEDIMSTIAQVDRPTTSQERPLIDSARTSTDERTNQAATSAFSTLDKAWNTIKSSKLLLGVVVLSAITTTVALALSPPGWVISALVVATIVLPVIAAKVEKGSMDFELTALMNIFRKNFDPIKIGDEDTRIILGAMPNQIGNRGEYLNEQHGVTAVLSLQEDWEAKGSGFARPYQQSDWDKLDVGFKRLDIKDHTLLGTQEMEQAADFINEQLKSNPNGNVYVHCRAGVGRSATAVAAYLIKYKDLSPEEALLTIQSSRSSATIGKKLPSLLAFNQSLGKDNPKLSTKQEKAYDKAFAKLERKEEKGKLTAGETEILKTLRPQ